MIVFFLISYCLPSVKLQKMEDEARQFLLTQFLATRTEEDNSNEKFRQLLRLSQLVNAVNLAPKKKWHNRPRDDLPADLDATNKELTELQASVDSLTVSREVLSAEKTKMKEGIEGLFDDVVLDDAGVKTSTSCVQNTENCKKDDVSSPLRSNDAEVDLSGALQHLRQLNLRSASNTKSSATKR